MNWTSQIYEAMLLYPAKMALWTPKQGRINFQEMASLCRRAQASLRRLGLKRGDSVLLLDLPGPRLYAAIIAINSLGASVLFVEPWMPVARINHVIQMVKPKIFWSPLLGQAWALRIRSIRSIPQWVRPRFIDQVNDPQEFMSEVMDPHELAILTFSSGTSGQPKGIPRTQGYLQEVNALFRRYDTEVDTKPDLAIFANAVLYQLGRSRGTLLVPPSWSMRVLKQIAHLPRELQAHTCTCGPAFLKRLMQTPGFEQLRWIGVGGALIDAPLLEEAFRRFPSVEFDIIYGSTEVEPVAHAAARLAVQKSRDAGHFQVLHLGQAVPDIELDPQPDTLWVSGVHVSPEYLTASDEDRRLKRRDASGKLWHAMGDRIRVGDDGLWYQGRSFQKAEDFAAEQKIYETLQHSACYITRDHLDRPVLLGENIAQHRLTLQKIYPELAGIYETKIIRDKRHHARIDRTASQRRWQGILRSS